MDVGGGTAGQQGERQARHDLDHVARVGAGLAHCPLSNAYFAGAVLRVRRALERGVRIGLGTDVSSGAHPGLLHQCAMAVTALWLATLGGASVPGQPVGLIAPGRPFDAFVVDLDRPGSALARWDDLDTEERVFEKIVHLAGPGEIRQVWVQGRQVTGAIPTG